MRIFYVDDSGDESIAVLAALTFEIDAWSLVLKEWLGWRKWLWKQYGLPTDFELHALEFVSGRGEITSQSAGGEVHEPPISRTVGLRKEAYRRSLAQINRQEEVSVLGVACEGKTIAETYTGFIAELDELLADRNEEAIIVVDGLDDSSYRPAHRRLEIKTRRILEDPLMQSSRHNQLIQMADLVAHAAFQHLQEDEERRFMWDWYPRLLSDSFFAEEWGKPKIWVPR